MTLKVHHLRPAPGAKKPKTRVGRGEGSKGKTAGRGTKGTKARYQVPANFEGGQMPLHMRLPKLRGFKNPNRVPFQVVNLDKLSAPCFPRAAPSASDELVAAGAVRAGRPVKILGTGDISVSCRSRRTSSPPPRRKRSRQQAGRPPSFRVGHVAVRPWAYARNLLLSSLSSTTCWRINRAIGLSVFGRAFRTPDLRTKMLFALGMIAIYRIGSFVPTPGIDYPAVQECIEAVEGDSLYALINLFSGGALLQLSIFALGIMPYITASIILQLLTVVIPRLETLKKDGQAGQAKITQYTRYLTMGLAVLQSTGIIALARSGQLIRGCPNEIVPDDSLFVIITMIAVMTAGTGIIMWLGELITDRGIGNGMSLLIFTSIIAGFPGQLSGIYASQGAWTILVVLGVGIAVVAFVVLMEQGQRRIPVQYAKRMVGRRQYGGSSTYIPIKVNQAGIIPVIFASSMLYLPVLFVTISNNTGAINTWVQANLVNGSGAWYAGLFFVLTVFFTYFYVAITFNADDVADNMKKYGGFIPGIRAGRPTVGVPRLRSDPADGRRLGVPCRDRRHPDRGVRRLRPGQNFLFGGTSILIMVGVGLDTVKQIESQLQQRNYEGFLR